MSLGTCAIFTNLALTEFEPSTSPWDASVLTTGHEDRRERQMFFVRALVVKTIPHRLRPLAVSGECFELAYLGTLMGWERKVSKNITGWCWGHAHKNARAGFRSAVVVKRITAPPAQMPRGGFTNANGRDFLASPPTIFGRSAITSTDISPRSTLATVSVARGLRYS